MGRVRRFAEGALPRTPLAGVLTWSWHRPADWNHVYFRSAEAPNSSPRAGFTSDTPLRASELHLHALAGQAPRGLRVQLQTLPCGVFTLVDTHFELDGRRLSAALPDAPFYGLAVSLEAGGGPSDRPHFLAFEALSLTLRMPGLAVRALGGRDRPDLPFPGEGLPGCLLHLHECTALRFDLPASAPFHGLRLEFARLGRFGDAGQIRRLLSGASLAVQRVDGEESPVSMRWQVDADLAGVHGGVTVARGEVHPDAAHLGPVHGATLRLTGVSPEAALLSAAWLEDRTRSRLGALGSVSSEAPPVRSSDVDAPGDPPGDALRALLCPTPEAARAMHPAPPMATSVGLPGHRDRVGVTPAGVVLVHGAKYSSQADTPSGALHLGIAAAGTPTLDPRPGCIYARWAGSDGESPLELTVAVDSECAHVRLRSGLDRTLRVSFCLRDALVSLPFSPSVVWRSDALGGPAAALLVDSGQVFAHVTGLRAPPTVDAGPYENVLTLQLPGGPEGVVFSLSLRGEPSASEARDLSPSDPIERGIRAWHAARDAELGPAPNVHLSGLWAARLRALLDQSAQAFDAAHSVPYGRFPGCYDADVFGLEEDWLFHALAAWGFGEAAWRGFRSTYLRATHLDKAHYLHDLRNGLTPWQAARLLALAPCSGFPTQSEAALLREAGEWVMEARRHDTPGALPGLLPPFRYGGDLDFPTQSLTGNAVNVSGLHALSALPGFDSAERARFAAEARAFRGAWEAALDAVRTVDAGGRALIPMHTGGGDPGQYHALMVAGILEPLMLLAADDPRLICLHEQMEESGALRLGLPRFDAWGTGGCGIDAHYAIGYLQAQLHRSRPERFQTGLAGLLGSAMDPVTTSFREVSDLLSAGAQPFFPDFLPGRLLAQAEPCVGGLGVSLELLRAALLCEIPDAMGLPSRVVRILPAPPPDLWDGGDFHLREMPTAGGSVSVRVRNRLRNEASFVEVEIDAPRVESLRLHAPTPPGFARTAGPTEETLPPGRHVRRWEYRRTADSARVKTAIIPAAGLGTRLFPATLGVPKELLPLGVAPAILGSLLELENAGIADVVVILGPGKDALRRVLDPDTWPAAVAESAATVALRSLVSRLCVRFAVQSEPKGALDAIARGRALSPDGPYVVLYPDFVHLPDQTGLAHVLAAWGAVRCTTYALYAPDPRLASRFGGTALVTPAAGSRTGPALGTMLAGVRAPFEQPNAGELRSMFAVVQDEAWDAALAAAQRPGAPHLDDATLLPTLDALARAGALAGTLLPGETLDLGVAPGYLEAVRRFAAGEARWRTVT